MASQFITDETKLFSMNGGHWVDNGNCLKLAHGDAIISRWKARTSSVAAGSRRWAQIHTARQSCNQKGGLTDRIKTPR